MYLPQFDFFVLSGKNNVLHVLPLTHASPGCPRKKSVTPLIYIKTVAWNAHDETLRCQMTFLGKAGVEKRLTSVYILHTAIPISLFVVSGQCAVLLFRF